MLCESSSPGSGVTLGCIVCVPLSIVSAESLAVSMRFPALEASALELAILLYIVNPKVLYLSN